MAILVVTPTLQGNAAVPQRLAPPPEACTVLEEQYPVVAPTDPSLITVSEMQGFTENQFNTLENSATRELTITGIQLHWDGTVGRLENLRTTRDVKRFRIFADEVLIAQELSWKGADVEIYARRLSFRDTGCINTTAQSFGTQAFSENQLNGRPVDESGKYPVDAQGNYLLKGKDGRNGENAGSITLCVAELDLGPAGSPKRFVCQGSPGQLGEPGGIKPYKQAETNPNFSKNAPALSLEDIVTAINNKENSTADINGLGYWRYPGDSGETGDLYGGLKGREHFARKEVTDVRLLMAFQHFLKGQLNEVRLPENRVIDHDITWQAPAPIGEDAANRRRTSDGADAYPSGTTGKGGDGGAIVTAPSLVELARMGHDGRGGASQPSDDVAGDTPGEPNPSYFANILIVQRIIFTQELKPQAVYYPHQARRGDGSRGSAAGQGQPAQVQGSADPDGWLDPILLRTVLAYAKQLYSNGHRLESFNLLKPYYAALQQARPDNSAMTVERDACKQAIDTVVYNFRQNLDLYGYPPGWVPRFSADSYFRLYLSDRSFSYKFVYIMSKALSLIDSVEHAAGMLDLVASQTEQAIGRIQSELGANYRRYHDARDALDAAIETFNQAQIKLNDINARIESDAENVAKERRIISGAFALLGAVAKAIPVYQPMLSGVGAVLDGIGTGVAELPADPAGAKDGLGFLKSVSGTIGKTLDDNASSFKSQFDDRLRQKYADKLKDGTDDLSQKIAKTQTTMRQLDAEADALSDNAYRNLLKRDDLAYLLKKDEAVTAQITATAHNRDELRQKIAEANKLIQDLPSGAGDGSLAAGLAGARKQACLAAKAKCYARLADADRLVQDLQQVKARANAASDAHKKAKADLDAATKKRDELKAQKDTLDGLLKQKTKKETQEAMADAKDKFSSVLDTSRRLSKGVSQAAGAIQSMLAPVKPEDQDVQKFRSQILESRYKEIYQEALQLVAAGQAKKTEAIVALQSCNREILAQTSELNDSLHGSIELSRNRQRLSVGLDEGVKTAIREMQRTAADRMDFYLYLVRKAFMYEQLRPVGAGLADVNAFVTRCDQWIANNRKALKGFAGSKADWAVDPVGYLAELDKVAGSDFADFGNLMLKETLGELAREIIERRNRSGPETTNDYHVEFNPDMVGALSASRLLRVDEVAQLFPDFKEMLNRNASIRVSGVAMANRDFRVRCSDGFAGPLRVELVFGREFVLRGGEGRFYVFRLSDAEEPIRYGFNINDLTEDKTTPGWKTGTIKADQKAQVDELFKTIMSKQFADSHEYQEMSPSVLSSLDIRMSLGAEHIEQIGHLALNITLSLG